MIPNHERYDWLTEADVEEEFLLGAMMPLVLVADDDPDMCQTIGQLLAANGYRVIGVNDGMNLMHYLEEAERHPEWVTWPDVIVADVRMPRASGLQALEDIRARDWSTPVILISAFADDEVRNEAGRLGAAVMPKPFDFHDLIDRVRIIAPPS